MKNRIAVFLSAMILLVASISGAFAQEIVIYSARKEHLIKPLFDVYTQKTGVKITYLTGTAGALVERLKAEGPNSPADLQATSGTLPKRGFSHRWARRR